jgi:hypothetical protein
MVFHGNAMPPHFLTPLLFAGTLWAVPAPGCAEADLATWLASKPGTLHAAPDHPWLQEVTFHTRLHWQYAWVSGRSGGHDFWYESGGEVRRFYFGPTVRFLDLFTLKADANLVADDSPGGGDLKFGYDSMFELYLSADLRRFIDSPAVDSFKLSYGRREQQLTEEHATSSRDILTVERSMLDAYILPGVPVPSNPTGIWAELKSGRHLFSGGILSTDHGSELSDWGDGRLYWLTWRCDLTDLAGMEMAEVSLNFVANDTESDEQQGVGYDHAATAWARFGEGPWAIRGSLIYGENRSSTPGRGGAFGGIDLLPTWWLVPEKLQFAARAEYAVAAEAEGLRLASRYARIAGEIDNEDLPALARGRGDRHASLYAGLNWFIVHPHLKLMTGIEWERMENSKTGTTAYDGITGWVAMRVHF